MKIVHYISQVSFSDAEWESLLQKVLEYPDFSEYDVDKAMVILREYWGCFPHNQFLIINTGLDSDKEIDIFTSFVLADSVAYLKRRVAKLSLEEVEGIPGSDILSRNERELSVFRFSPVDYIETNVAFDLQAKEFVDKRSIKL